MAQGHEDVAQDSGRPHRMTASTHALHRELCNHCRCGGEWGGRQALRHFGVNEPRSHHGDIHSCTSERIAEALCERIDARFRGSVDEIRRTSALSGHARQHDDVAMLLHPHTGRQSETDADGTGVVHMRRGNSSCRVGVEVVL